MDEQIILTPPTPQELPFKVHDIEQILKQINPQLVSQEQVDTVIAALRACSLTVHKWVLPSLGTWSPDEIRYYGPLVDSIDDLLDRASDEVLIDEQPYDALGHIWPAILTFKEIWNKMDKKGLTA